MKRLKIFSEITSGFIAHLSNRLLFLLMGICFFYFNSNAQNIKWLRVGDLQSPFSEYGAETEGQFDFTNTGENYFTWPAKYDYDQTVTRSKGLWIGCKNFFEPTENKQISYKVIGVGPRAIASPEMVFPQSIRLIGKYPHPSVSVDGENATNLDIYDLVDEYDPNLPCDRMVEIKFNTSIGVSVTKKVLYFANSLHGNYVIYDYVFKNTGIYNSAGDVHQQTLQDAWFYFNTRYAFGGVTSIAGFNASWGAFASGWGTNMLYRSFGQVPASSEVKDKQGNPMRGFYAWAGPYNGAPRTTSYDEDWGTPNLDPVNGNGVLGTAKYAGCVTLYASKSPAEYDINDPSQPKTTWYDDADSNPLWAATPSQTDVLFMQQRFEFMSEGHPTIQYDAAVGNGNYSQNYRAANRNSVGNTSQAQSFGPYTLAPGDSVHIIYAECVAGISWEKAREVGGNWFQWFNGIGNPPLVNPDGSTTTDYNEYKRKWVVEACRDSLITTFRNAVENYNSNYNQPKPPDPPSTFSVNGGGDRIRLEWADNAASDPHFGGYVIYRSQGQVLTWETKYEKVFETSDPGVTLFDDLTAKRGNDYYYYIQTKDDGKQVPGTVLYSSLFWTVTNGGAILGRPAITSPPQPPDNDTTHWKYLTDRGPWSDQTTYVMYDAVSYNSATYICMVDTLLANTSTPDIANAWNLSSYVGDWKSGNEYKAFNVVSYNNARFVTPFSISGGSLLDLVRVVPNPYDIRGRFFQFGDQYQYDRIAFYGLPPVCKLRIFTERGDLVWEKEHTSQTGDEHWDSKTSSGQIIVSGIYILYVETPEGKSVIRKFVVIR